MMIELPIKIRKASEHGKNQIGWLDSSHGFSFGEYYNEDNMNFGDLIVFNDDIVLQGKGFGSHSHDNAEIFSFVIEGALEHKDSAGNHGIINEYEIQSISAGSGITHSEFNASKEDKVHFLQIWLKPRNLGSKPRYEQKSFKDLKDKKGIFKLISGEKSDDVVYIDQNAQFYVGNLEKDTAKIEIGKGRGIYLYVLEGNLEVDKTQMAKGDSAEITNLKQVGISSLSHSKFVMLDLSVA
jgi:quercetin 2,3-dioxygenase